MNSLLRLLDLVRQDLGAADARAEIGGGEPTDPKLVWAAHPGGFRVVVVFNEAPADPGDKHRRLVELLESFAGVNAGVDGVELRSDSSLERRLDAELDALAARVEAACAFVVDAESPVIWGTSGRRHLDDGVDMVTRLSGVLRRAKQAGINPFELVSLAGDAAELELRLTGRGLDPWSARFLVREQERCSGAGSTFRRELAAASALASLREVWTDGPSSPVEPRSLDEHFGVVARSFAVSYALVLAFDGTFSPLHAEAAALHALPVIERLVMALPPIEPPDKPGKLLRLRPPR